MFLDAVHGSNILGMRYRSQVILKKRGLENRFT